MTANVSAAGAAVPAPGETALSVRNLRISVADGSLVIAPCFSCDIRAGETLALFGPSGQGKTSVALALVGLLPSGLAAQWDDLRIQGSPIQALQDQRLRILRGSRIGFVFQDPLAALNPVLPCGTQIEEPLCFHRTETAEHNRSRALALLHELGLSDPERIYRSFPRQLSGGQLQRVTLARTLIARPSLLIADEPTTALDPETRKDVINLLEQIKNRHDMAMLLITHDQETVRRLADRVVDIDGSPVMLEERRTTPDQLPHCPSAAETHQQPATIGEANQRILSVRGLSKTFHPTVVSLLNRSLPGAIIHNIDLDVGKSEVIGIVGESGAGKTTLMRCIAGLTEPDLGTISVDGQVRKRGLAGMAKGEIQVIFQNPYLSLPPHFSIRRILQDGLRTAGLGKKKLESEAVNLLIAVNLEPGILNRLPSELSGGQCQRVAIARCLARRPRVLLADEPTASLDQESKSTVASLLRETARSRSISVIVASHDHELLMTIADRIFMVARGEIFPVRRDLLQTPALTEA